MPPIALKSFHIQNFRGVKDTKVEGIPLNTRWIFLTGENGFGKTSILQAIAAGLLVASNYNLGGTIDIEFTKKDQLCTNKLYPNGEHADEIMNDFLCAYGSSRLRVSAGSSRETVEAQSVINSLFSSESLLLDTEERLKDWSENYKAGFDELETLFKNLLPRLGKIKVEFNKNTKSSEVKYYEKDADNVAFKEGVTFSQLAAGYKNIIAMIGDMVYRLSLKQNVRKLSNLEGIVIIDEIELHLHPKYQKIFIEKLTELFPKIQFIVSTHSPIPLLGSPKEMIVIQVNRTEEEGIVAKILDINFQNLTPEDILSSPVFGFDDFIPTSNENLEAISTEQSPTEAKQILGLKQKLKLLKANLNFN